MCERFKGKFMTQSRIVILGIALALAGCGSRTDQNSNSSQSDARENGTGQIAGAQPSEQAETTKVLLAAAEPFEALTESAFVAKPTELESLIANAEKEAASLKAGVSTKLGQRLQDHIAAIRAAQAANRRTDVALSSIEGYREIVTAVPGPTRVPVDVSLLDYAGFRYDADVQAVPPRWQDMTDAVTFARERWSNIERLPALGKLQPRFGAALDSMDAAIKAKNVVAARAAAKVELDMVDELEGAFPS
jgi:uncharacterized lipoprotein YmbA